MSKFRVGDWVIRKSDGLVGRMDSEFVPWRSGWYGLIARGDDLRGPVCPYGPIARYHDEIEPYELKVGDQIKYCRQFYNSETGEREWFERQGWISEIRQCYFPGGVSPKYSYTTTTYTFQFGHAINFGPLFKDCCELELDETEIYECSHKVKNG